MGHVILVAIEVEAPSRAEAELWLHDHLPQPGIEFETEGMSVECWWIAEDDRRDRSDCDSAVFVPMGRQDVARACLRRNGMVLWRNL